jgi:hypothetical protein
VSVTAGQLRINQRIAQAAVRRVNELMARVDRVGSGAEEVPRGDPSDITLSVRQLLINQRIAQAAVLRANSLERRLVGVAIGPLRDGPVQGSLTLNARQLLINQRIAQAAIRRAHALEARIPELPFPNPSPLSPELDSLVGVIPDGDRAIMVVQTIQRRGTLGDATPLAVGGTVPVMFPSDVDPNAIPDGTGISVIGVVSGGVMYGMHLAFENPQQP